MCKRCDAAGEGGNISTGADRRTFIAGGTAAVLASPLIGTSALAAAQAGIASTGWGTSDPTQPLKPVSFRRRDLRPDDILIDILYAGVCHSDIHTGRGEWGPVDYMLVPGHEIVGRVSAVGRSVTKFKVGDVAGVGCMVDSCGKCDFCRQDLEQFCTVGMTTTYGKAPDGEVVYGGYSKNVVVREKFAITIPAALDIRSAAPILCAGITTFSPIQHWKAAAGQKVGVIGMGGLGHMAVKLLKAKGVDTTVFTTSPGKVADATRMGAHEAVLWHDKAGFERLKGQFDLLLSTVPQAYEVNPFLDLLNVDGTLVNVGVVGDLPKVSNQKMIMGRRSVAGSLIGGIAETQEVVNFCAANRIAPEVQIIPISRVNEAWDRVVSKDARYRFVIDMSSLPA